MVVLCVLLHRVGRIDLGLLFHSSLSLQWILHFMTYVNHFCYHILPVVGTGTWNEFFSSFFKEVKSFLVRVVTTFYVSGALEDVFIRMSDFLSYIPEKLQSKLRVYIVCVGVVGLVSSVKADLKKFNEVPAQMLCSAMGMPPNRQFCALLWCLSKHHLVWISQIGKSLK